MAVIIVFFSLIILQAILKASKRPPQTGAESLIGKVAVAETSMNPNGQAKINHQTWSATSIGGEVQKGQQVLIKDVSGVRLLVVTEESDSKPDQST